MSSFILIVELKTWTTRVRSRCCNDDLHQEQRQNQRVKETHSHAGWNGNWGEEVNQVWNFWHVIEPLDSCAHYQESALVSFNHDHRLVYTKPSEDLSLERTGTKRLAGESMKRLSIKVFRKPVKGKRENIFTMEKLQVFSLLFFQQITSLQFFSTDAFASTELTRPHWITRTCCWSQ